MKKFAERIQKMRIASGPDRPWRARTLRERTVRPAALRPGALAALLLAGALLLSGCSGKGASADSSAAQDTAAATWETGTAADTNTTAAAAEAGWGMDGGGMAEEMAVAEAASAEEAGMEPGGADILDESAAQGRKLIKRVDASVETRDFDGFLAALEQQVEQMGGYVQRAEASGDSYRYESQRYAYYTVRIPADSLDRFMDQVGSLGNITYRAEEEEDITLQYVDTQSRKEALEIQQERLLLLLEQAETVEDMITIETRLSEVRYELESYSSQLLTFDNQVDYATVYLDIQEVERETPAAAQSDWERIKVGFAESLYDVAAGIKNFAVGVVIDLPYLAVWAVALLLLYFLGRIVYHKILERGMSREERLESRRKRREEKARRRQERRRRRQEKRGNKEDGQGNGTGQ